MHSKPSVKNSTKMDKYEHVLDIIEHPENYGEDNLREIMSDKETREIYNLLCKTEGVPGMEQKPDIAAEWKNFIEAHSTRGSRFFGRRASRAASIAVIVCTSILAVGAGIAVTVAIKGHRQETRAMAETTISTPSEGTSADIVTAGTDTVTEAKASPVMFENETLEKVMKTIGAMYGAEVKFDNEESARLHLYYRLDPNLSLEEVISQLNTFEQINIEHKGKQLIVY